MTNDPHDDKGRRLYKARGPDGEVAWVDHDELWRLQQGQTERLRHQRARRRRLVLLALVGLVALAFVLVLFRLRFGLESRPADTAVATSQTSAADDPVGAAASRTVPTEPEVTAARPEPESDSPAVSAEPQPAPSPTEEVTEAVRAWAAAWESQDVAGYLASYDGEFEPADGAERSSWQNLRRRRLTAPTSIRVEIEELVITLRDSGRAEVRFLQSYTSPDYADVVRKNLDLVDQEGAWRIVAERVETP